MVVSIDTTKLLAAFLAGILSGGGTYAGCRWLFAYLALQGVWLSPRRKRVLVLPICLGIVAIALVLQVVLRIAPLTPDGILIALTTAFTASQMVHAKDLRS
jgi:hypothetical protein